MFFHRHLVGSNRQVTASFRRHYDPGEHTRPDPSALLTVGDGLGCSVFTLMRRNRAIIDTGVTGSPTNGMLPELEKLGKDIRDVTLDPADPRAHRSPRWRL